jgi:putative transposase
MIRYLYMEQNRSKYRIAKMAQWPQVSKSGYYAWKKRPQSPHCMENEALLKETIRIHEASHGTYGGRKITHKINRKSEKPVNHKRIEHIVGENGIRSKSHKKYKTTTNKQKNYPEQGF